MFSRLKNLFVVLVMLSIFMSSIAFILQNFKNQPILARNQDSLIRQSPFHIYIPPQKLSNPPEIVKAVYITGYSAGTKTYLNYLSNLFKNTEINAVVVDVKDSTGKVSYNSGSADARKYNLYNGAIKDIDGLVNFFHDQNVYVIARIAVFEDPMYAKARSELAVYDEAKTTDKSQPVLWQDNKGLSWVDPSSKDVWDYNISLAKDALYHGFDEVNFDYVRFPSDGKTENMGFPVWDQKITRPAVIKEFFSYLRQQLKGEKISVDLFGQTTTNTDDMGIGQIIENAFENFDYISPMVYPSHYAANFGGFLNPAGHPYEIVKYSMDSALARKNAFQKSLQDLAIKDVQPADSSFASLQSSILTHISLAKFRPWLQDFDMGAYYTADMVKAEIKATQDALGEEYRGYMLWNPSNIYTQDAVRHNN